jgi:rhamnulokinase
VSLHAAVDLGASSGRVVLARVEPDRVDLDVVHRFPNVPVRLPDGLHWDVLRLYAEVLEGLAAAARAASERGEALVSVGIDSWAVDYGLLDASGALLGNPFHYRDSRTEKVIDEVHQRVSPAELYAINGLQFLPFNTIYQLAAARGTPQFAVADTLLLIPDLLGYFLAGGRGAERTNASTTGLLDVGTGSWSDRAAAAAGVDAALLPPLRAPGDVLGSFRPVVLADTGLPAGAVLTAVGSHDTASAVVGVPAQGDRWAYISCGTWSLVGVELDRPVLSEESRAANFTNEGGVDGRIRYLRNVMGLWLLQESLRVWQRAGMPADVATLLSVAADVPAGGPVIDVDSREFLPPGDMPARIADACRRRGQKPPADQAQVVRCILDSLAAAYARTLREVIELTGEELAVVHVVGGGAQNALLCQLTADACELPVLAGPIEATALGNALVQARAAGSVRGDLATLRSLLAATQALTRYEPRR